MNSQQIKAQIEKLQAAGPDLPKAAAKRLQNLLALQAAALAESVSITNFRYLAEGVTTRYGTTRECPVCLEIGAAHQPKWGNGITMIVHSLEAVPTIADVILVSRKGNDWVFTDAGAKGKFRLKDDYHMLSADGKPVLPASAEAKAKKVVPKIGAKVDHGSSSGDPTFSFNGRTVVFTAEVPKNKFVDLLKPAVAKVGKQKAAGAPVAEWRQIAAAKAWETIRARRALAAANS